MVMVCFKVIVKGTGLDFYYNLVFVNRVKNIKIVFQSNFFVYLVFSYSKYIFCFVIYLLKNKNFSLGLTFMCYVIGIEVFV